MDPEGPVEQVLLPYYDSAQDPVVRDCEAFAVCAHVLHARNL